MLGEEGLSKSRAMITVENFLQEFNSRIMSKSVKTENISFLEIYRVINANDIPVLWLTVVRTFCFCSLVPAWSCHWKNILANTLGISTGRHAHSSARR